MTPLIVIQARLGSKRLPGKILLPLGPEGKPVLQHVVERCQRTGYDVAVIAPAQEWDWGGAWKGWPFHVSFVGGSVNDVLDRYAFYVGSKVHGSPEAIVRITADCPLVDPQLIEATVQAVRDGADYAGNTVERHWPRGCDVECFTTELLQRAHQEATDPYDREHVTPWMQRWATAPMALPASVRPVDALSRWRWTLDTPKDFEWLKTAFTRFPDPSLEQVAAYSRMHGPPLDP